MSKIVIKVYTKIVSLFGLGEMPGPNTKLFNFLPTKQMTYFNSVCNET